MSITATDTTERSKGTIKSQDISGAVGLGGGVVDEVRFGVNDGTVVAVWEGVGVGVEEGKAGV